MKRTISIGMTVLLVLSLILSYASADWVVPTNKPINNESKTASQGAGYTSTFRIKVTEDSLATRSGPSTEHTGNGTLANMKNRVVTVLSRSAGGSGIGWVEIELEYTNGGLSPRVDWCAAPQSD